MTKEEFIRKLTSRKFWLAVAAFVSSMIIATRGDAGTAETVSGLIMSGATVIAYIIGEGLVDASASPAGETPSVSSADISLKEGDGLRAEEIE